MVVKLLKGTFSDPELTSAVAGIDIETLLVWGLIDGIVPVAHGEMLRHTIPHSQLAVMEEVAHLPMSEKPETFHRLLRDFLLRDEGEELPNVIFS
jgi:pimeloyl-ACP methyl ester carboxylesterase